MNSSEFARWTALSSDVFLLVTRNGEILAANSAVRELDRVPAEIIGKNLTDLVADPPEVVLDALRLASRSRQPLASALRLHCNGPDLDFRCDAMLADNPSEGAKKTLLIKLTPRERALKPYRLVNQKINELNSELQRRRVLEEDLRRTAERLSEADRRKDEFLATLAHEIRNPLSPISSGLELMKTLVHDPARLEQVRAMMERQTRLLVTLVDDLLDVSRITQGRLKLRKTRAALSEIVDTALESSQPAITAKKHRLSVRVPESVELEADPHRLAQVLSNLLNNAAKFTPDGGTIELAAETSGRDLLIAVRDSGVGIPPELQEGIFDLFGQVDQCMDAGSAGMGIGLALVKALVEMHGGSVAVQSAGAGTGTTVSLCLPIIVGTPIEDLAGFPLHPAEEPTRDRRRVLIVDDSADAAHLMGLMIEALGHEVRLAANGEMALAAGAEFLPDIVLMDLGMPRMNGYEAARHMRRESWGRTVFLVALSGWGQEQDRLRTAEAGFDQHLVKPAKPEYLRHLIDQLRQNRLPAANS